MVVPLIAAAAPEVLARITPDVIKTISSIGAAKDNNLVDFVWQPMVKIRKSWPGYAEAVKMHPSGEMPDPHFPTGIRWCVPAWLALISIFTGVSIVTLVGLESAGMLGGIKEALGIKQKKGVFGFGLLPF